MDGPDALPPWSPFTSALDLGVFLTEVLDRATQGFDVRGLDVRHGVVLVRTDDGDTTLGLERLARLCHLNEPSAWPTLISSYLDHLAEVSTADVTATLADFDAVAHRLRLRMHPPGRLPAPADDLVLSTELPGLIGCLAVDLDGALAYVLPRHLDAWGVDGEELLGRARGQTLALDHDVFVAGSAEEAALLAVVDADTNVTATRVLDPTPLMALLPGAEGVLVATPAPTTVIALVVAGSASAGPLETFVSAAGAEVGHPDRWPPLAWWWTPTTGHHLLDARRVGDRWCLRPPVALPSWPWPPSR